MRLIMECATKPLPKVNFLYVFMYLHASSVVNTFTRILYFAPLIKRCIVNVKSDNTILHLN